MTGKNNRTLQCGDEEMRELAQKTVILKKAVSAKHLAGAVIEQDFFTACAYLPDEFIDLLILDPPYNLAKNYNGNHFKVRRTADYQGWFDEIMTRLKPKLKATASVYICADWKTSVIISPVLDEHFIVRNRITWEREKGRGAAANWKNCSEDIWFCTMGRDFYFNVDAVKMRKQVLAPYKAENGQPKDWSESAAGKYRLTHPSNLWTDMTVPFWSMPENTVHPTQKPEKLMAKLMMASSKVGDFVFDPFLGSGTSAVVAKKLKRRFAGIEMNKEYCCLALKRLEKAAESSAIQGYEDGVFWERNSGAAKRLNSVRRQKRNNAWV